LQRHRHREAECLRRLHIDPQLEPRRLLHRQVGWLLAAPGRARLATRPSLTGSSATPNTIGIVADAVLAASEAVALPGVATPRQPWLGRE
jgi:hypothetical protein